MNNDRLAHEAEKDIEYADNIGDDGGQYFLLRSIAKSLLLIGIQLDNIDDALRNTIGGLPR